MFYFLAFLWGNILVWELTDPCWGPDVLGFWTAPALTIGSTTHTKDLRSQVPQYKERRGLVASWTTITMT